MFTYTRPMKRGIALLAAGVLSMTLVACGDNASSDPATSRTAPNGDVFNGADVEFATTMVPHHAQAVQMVVMAQGRPLDPDVEELANQIRDAQVPEIETMTDWLTAWGEEIPETSLDHSNAGHDMSDMSSDGVEPVEGMMSSADMDELENASDAEFQDMWLTMMIEHHNGAIEMARTEQSDGAFAPAIDLAASIESAQEAEIKTLEGLVGS